MSDHSHKHHHATFLHIAAKSLIAALVSHYAPGVKVMEPMVDSEVDQLIDKLANYHTRADRDA